MRQAADELRAELAGDTVDVRRQPQHQRSERLHRRLRVLRLRPGQALARRLRARRGRVRAPGRARRSSSAPPRSACSRASTPTGTLEDYGRWLRAGQGGGAAAPPARVLADGGRTTCASARAARRDEVFEHLREAGLGSTPGHRRRGARTTACAQRISPEQAAGGALGGDHRGRRTRAGLRSTVDGDVRPHRGAVGAGRAHARGARAAGAHRRLHRVRAALASSRSTRCSGARTGSRRSRARRTSSTPRSSGSRSGETITNLQASWVKMGLDAATEALRWGVNDLGGTLMEESISRLAGSYHGVKLEPEDLIAAAHARGPARRRSARRSTRSAAATTCRSRREARLQGLGRAVRPASSCSSTSRQAEADRARGRSASPTTSSPGATTAATRRRARLARRAAAAHRAAVLGTSVLTPTMRYHPSVVAQAFATLGCLAPGPRLPRRGHRRGA